jgi:hypothetical protein
MVITYNCIQCGKQLYQNDFSDYVKQISIKDDVSAVSVKEMDDNIHREELELHNNAIDNMNNHLEFMGITHIKWLEKWWGPNLHYWCDNCQIWSET